MTHQFSRSGFVTVGAELSILVVAHGSGVLVELKSGETLNGTLVSSDAFMNLVLSKVIQTSPDGKQFLELSESYVRGSNIKCLQLSDKVIDDVKKQAEQNSNSHHRSDGRGRGRGGRGRGGDRGRGDRGRGRGGRGGPRD
ncbi:hypothetical protein N7495_000399 [Penicillium taxi]|uniref:uncharacterized protein n=1 Tax=Penicillium taxi TaxID=168475 RepID=UPI0025457278|nr:uncharacterized protein N7495_000399 [Penicillium taxi]KAJ5907717.1 hypothetical protein N7495_000399 [Penicillium taxi]